MELTIFEIYSMAPGGMSQKTPEEDRKDPILRHGPFRPTVIN